MKKIIVICFIFIMCFSFVLANGTTNNATDKTATIPVNVTVLPHSTLDVITPNASLLFILDPDSQEYKDLPTPVGRENGYQGGIASSSVIIRIRTNYDTDVKFTYVQENGDLYGKLHLRLEVWDADENNNYNRIGGSGSWELAWAWRPYPDDHRPGERRLFHAIGENYYGITYYLQGIDDLDWWQIEARNEEILGYIFITVSDFNNN